MDRVTSGTTHFGARVEAPSAATRNPRDHAPDPQSEGNDAHHRHRQLTHAERRHSFRVPVDGRASIWMRGRLHGHYALSDLSIAGCSLHDGPVCHAGEHVELVLHLPDRPVFWLSALIRRSPEPGVIGVCFEHTDPRTEDRLQDLVVEVYTRMHADSDSFSLIVDARSHVRRGLVHKLDVVGERAIAVATPLDAVQLLLERGERISTAFIGPERADTPTYELVEFLARNYPRVRRVLVGDAREVAGAWVAEATGEVHGLLETPCSEDSLRRLVHRISALPHEELS